MSDALTLDTCEPEAYNEIVKEDACDALSGILMLVIESEPAACAGSANTLNATKRAAISNAFRFIYDTENMFVATAVAEDMSRRTK